MGVSLEYVLYEMSYANLSLYTASLPTYIPKHKDGETGGKKQDVINADDPKNRDKVRAFFNSIKD